VKRWLGKRENSITGETDIHAVLWKDLGVITTGPLCGVRREGSLNSSAMVLGFGDRMPQGPLYFQGIKTLR
jgi:hypothetical protein